MEVHSNPHFQSCTYQVSNPEMGNRPVLVTVSHSYTAIDEANLQVEPVESTQLEPLASQTQIETQRMKPRDDHMPG